MPALVTLGSEQDLNVKCASIDAFGSVAQHFKNEMVSFASIYPSLGFVDMKLMQLHDKTPDQKNDLLQIVDKIRVQMGAFIEDGSHEATMAVIHALVVAVPHTTERLRDYILNFICGKIMFRSVLLMS